MPVRDDGGDHAFVGNAPPVRGPQLELLPNRFHANAAAPADATNAAAGPLTVFQGEAGVASLKRASANDF